MSETLITKEVKAMVCDYCDKEIIKDDGYCYIHMVTKRDDEPSNEKKRVTHYLFSWTRPNKNGSEYVRYDFHPACIDKMVQNELKIMK